MFRLLIVVLSLNFFTSCKSHEVSNKYKDARVHPSDKENKEGVKSTKRIRKKFIKTQKKNDKQIGKHGKVWQKKKKQYR